MKILSALLGVLMMSGVVAACGDDNSNGSKFAACGATGTGNSNMACSSCIQNKCGDKITKCYGSNYNGGVCAAYIQCASNAPDPCKATSCMPSNDCATCTSEIGTCVASSCLSDCAAGSGAGGSGSGAGGSGSGAAGTGASPSTSGTCADLQNCCNKISDSTAKMGCQDTYSAAAGNDMYCGLAYNGLKQFCP